MVQRTSKAQTNAAWTSSKEHRDAWDRIFGKKPAPVEEEAADGTEAEGTATETQGVGPSPPTK